MTASVTWQNKDSQSTRLLELRERVQTNESDCAVNTALGGETSGRPGLQATRRHRRRPRRHSNSRRRRVDPIHESVNNANSTEPGRFRPIWYDGPWKS